MNLRILKTGFALALACALAAQQALAGTANVVNADGSSMLFEYSNDMMRVNMAEDGSSYMILRDGTIYAITNAEGRLMVIDAGQALTMFGGMAGAATPDMVATEVVSLKATGRTEQHAQITGEVYDLRFRDENGKERNAEVVLTDDARARAFRDAMHNFATTMSKVVGQDYTEATDDMQGRLSAMNKGVLRYGKDMTVTELTMDKVAADRFELPAAPTDISHIGAIFGQGLPTGAQGPATGSDQPQGDRGPISSFLGALGGSADTETDEPEENEEGDQEEASTDTGGAAEELGKAIGRIFGN